MKKEQRYNFHYMLQDIISGGEKDRTYSCLAYNAIDAQAKWMRYKNSMMLPYGTIATLVRVEPDNSRDEILDVTRWLIEGEGE